MMVRWDGGGWKWERELPAGKGAVFCDQNSWDLRGRGRSLTNCVTLFVLTSLSLTVLIYEKELTGDLPSKVIVRVK